MFMNKKDLEERENNSAGEGTILEAIYLRDSIGSVHI